MPLQEISDMRPFGPEGRIRRFIMIFLNVLVMPGVSLAGATGEWQR